MTFYILYKYNTNADLMKDYVIFHFKMITFVYILTFLFFLSFTWQVVYLKISHKLHWWMSERRESPGFPELIFTVGNRPGSLHFQSCHRHLSVWCLSECAGGVMDVRHWGTEFRFQSCSLHSITRIYPCPVSRVYACVIRLRISMRAR